MKTIVCVHYSCFPELHTAIKTNVFFEYCCFTKRWAPLLCSQSHESRCFFNLFAYQSFEKYENLAFFNTSASQHVNRRRETFLCRLCLARFGKFSGGPFKTINFKVRFQSKYMHAGSGAPQAYFDDFIDIYKSCNISEHCLFVRTVASLIFETQRGSLLYQYYCFPELRAAIYKTTYL